MECTPKSVSHKRDKKPFPPRPYFLLPLTGKVNHTTRLVTILINSITQQVDKKIIFKRHETPMGNPPGKETFGSLYTLPFPIVNEKKESRMLRDWNGQYEGRTRDLGVISTTL